MPTVQHSADKTQQNDLGIEATAYPHSTDTIILG